MNFNKNFKILTTIIFSFSFLVFGFSASAQKVLQCAPLKATVNNDLEVKNDLLIDNKAVITNDLTVGKDIYAASGSQKIYLGSDAASPYISNNLLNSGEGILFKSNGGDDFLWQSPSGTAPDAMILRSGGGLPNNNNYNLQVFGQVSPYQIHTQIIHLDSQGIGSGLNSNIIKLTNTAGSGNGAGMFIGDGNDNLLFSALQADGSPGTAMLALDTSNNNVGIQIVNPQITLAIGDDDTGLKWIGDGNFRLFSNGNYEIDITPGNVGIRNNLSVGNEFCLGGVCKSAWPAAVPETDPIWTAASANYYTKTNLQTAGQANVLWDNLTGVPAGLSDGDQVGIASVPVCGANQKLTGDLTGSPVCANDINTDTDTQDLSIAGNIISLTDGGAITLPGSGTANRIAKWTDATTLGDSQIRDNGGSVRIGTDMIYASKKFTVAGNSLLDGDAWVSGKLFTDGGLSVNKPCDLGFTRSGNACIATHGNEYLIKEFTNTAAQPSVNAWQTISINAIVGSTAKIAIIKGFCSENYMYIRKTGSIDPVKGYNTKDTNLICMADNNNTDYSSNRLSYFVGLNSNMEFDWRNDPTDAPTLTAGVYLIGYLEN